MTKKLITILVAEIEHSNGDMSNYTIARKDGDCSFTEEEKQNAIKKLNGMLDKESIICDVYEDSCLVWF